jgi:hypothetical protein
MIIWSQWSSLRVSQHQKFNIWGLYPNTRSKATSQVFTLSHLCCLELMCIVPAQASLYPHYPQPHSVNYAGQIATVSSNLPIPSSQD